MARGSGRWKHQHETPPAPMPEVRATGDAGAVFGGALFIALLGAALAGLFFT